MQDCIGRVRVVPQNGASRCLGGKSRTSELPKHGARTGRRDPRGARHYSTWTCCANTSGPPPNSKLPERRETGASPSPLSHVRGHISSIRERGRSQEQIVRLLCQAEAGSDIGEACRWHGSAEQTFSRWISSIGDWRERTATPPQLEEENVLTIGWWALATQRARIPHFQSCSIHALFRR